jgi:DNA (cytosine-5)-methyltransferase 1
MLFARGKCLLSAYYNEIEPEAAAWLRELVKEGLIPDGEVDETDIREIRPNDLRGFGQHHFFAGIGGWPLALRLAGWPEDRPVFTGSCPCQPFSAAGKRKGTKDERHLWPAFRWIIAQLRPSVCFGEQVESQDGCEWLSGVRADMEAIGYRVGAADLPAASVGLPHKRQRLFWVANRDGINGQGLRFHDGASPQATKAEPTAGVSVWTWEWVTDGQGNRRVRRIPYSGVCRVADGVSADVGLVRGFGNAIVPQVAAEFVGSFLDSVS